MRDEAQNENNLSLQDLLESCWRIKTCQFHQECLCRSDVERKSSQCEIYYNLIIAITLRKFKAMIFAMESKGFYLMLCDVFLEKFLKLKILHSDYD